LASDVFNAIFPLWFSSFVFTLVVEVPLFVFVARLRSRQADRAPIWRLVVAAAAGTCFTHPFLWFAWSQIIPDYGVYILSGELLVAIIESFTFFAIARPSRFYTAFAASFIANGCSYGLGLLLL
jgi:hypothetical protein